jgi:hypothetical protein
VEAMPRGPEKFKKSGSAIFSTFFLKKKGDTQLKNNPNNSFYSNVLNVTAGWSVIHVQLSL